MRSLGLRLALSAVLSALATHPALAELRVVKSDATGLEVEWTANRLNLESVPGTDGTFRRPASSSGFFLAEPGQPDLPRIVELVGIPARGEPRLRISSVVTASEPLPDMAPSPQPLVDGDAVSQVRSGALRSFPEGIFPRSWASLEGDFTMRGQRMTRLVLHPWRYDASRSELVWASTMRVRIEFGEPGEGFARNVRPDAKVWESTLDDALLNADVARGWRAPRERPTLRGGGDSFASSPNWIRVPIQRAGLYQVDYFVFSNLGIHPAEMNPATIRVFSGTNLQLEESYETPPPSFMTECAIFERGDGDEIFDIDDRYLFYALPPHGWANEYDPARPRTEHVENQYTDTSYYWITWDWTTGESGSFSSPPKRMATRTVPSVGPEFATSAPHRVHFEENNLENFRYRDEDGWFWEDLASRGRDRPYFLRIEDVESGDGQLTACFGSYRQVSFETLREVELKVRGVVVADTSWNHARDMAYVKVISDPFEGLLSDGTNTIQVNVKTSSPGSTDKIRTAWFDIEYDRSLRATGGSFVKFFSDPGSSDYELPGFDANEVFLFDVSEQHDVVRLTGFELTPPSPTRNVRFSDPGQTSVRWYVAASMEGVRPLPSPELVDIRGLHQPDNGAEYVIIYHPSLEAGALRFADLRRAHPDSLMGGPVLAVDLHDVYNEFSWGVVDPVAIRDFLAYACQNWSGSPPLFVTLVGDAAYDTKRNLAGSPPNLLSAYINRYKTEAGTQYDDLLNLNFYSTDDFFGYLETTDYDGSGQPALDVAIGRYPASDPRELDIFLNKLEAYLNKDMPGQWQNRVVATADDERTLDEGSREPDHTEQVEEECASWYPPALDKVKIYLTEFPRNAFGKKPEAQATFIEEFTRGALIVSYTGHGDQNTMAQEELFISQKIPELLNESRYPIFTTFSCTVSKFDLLSGNSMTELLLLHELGGAVATFSSGSLVFPAPSFNLHKAWLGALFGTPYDIDTLSRHLRPLGTAAMVAKVLTGRGPSPSGRRNNEKYNVLGDPALVPRYAPLLTRFESTSVDSNLTEGLVRVVRSSLIDDKGRVLDGSDGTVPFNGTAFVHVTENADTSGYTYDRGHIDYVLEGATVYRGEVPVRQGRFEVKFFIPETVLPGNSGRISVFAMEDGQPRMASGAYDSLRVAPTISSTQAGDDTEGPSIRIAFVGNENFVDGDFLFTDKPVFLITLADESGINLRPFPQFALLEAEVDGRERVSLAEDFSYLNGDFTQGQVRRILALSPGEHTVEVKAFDNIGNRSTSRVSFTIVSGSEGFDIPDDKVAFYPNPFQDSAHLVFSVNRDAQVRLKVFTIGGRKIYECRPEPALKGDGNRIHWDGRDSNGNPLANGTYLYKLEATSTNNEGESETDEYVGKVVKMR